MPEKRFETLLSRNDMAAISDPLPASNPLLTNQLHLAIHPYLEMSQQIDRRVVSHISG